MLIEEIKNIKSDTKELRKFGVTVGIVTGLFGGLFWWRGKDYYPYFLIISATLIFLGLAIPNILKPLQKVWMTVAVVMGWFMTRVILSILFYLVITPIRILAKLSGKNFLDVRFDKTQSKESYWVLQEKAQYEKINYEKQF